MAVNKVTVNNMTVLDLTKDDVTPANLAAGVKAHNAAGEQITGEYTPPVTSVNGQTGAVVLKSTVINATLLASGWDTSGEHAKYTLSNPNITATSNQEILPPVAPADDVLEALQVANIQDGGQIAGAMYLLAFGDKPTINLPIRIILRGDM